MSFEFIYMRKFFIVLVAVGMFINVNAVFAAPGSHSGVRLYCSHLEDLQDILTQEPDYKFYGGPLESSSDWHGMPFYNYKWFENGIEDKDIQSMREICPEINIDELEPVAMDYGSQIIMENGLSLSHLYVIKRNLDWSDSEIADALPKIKEELQLKNKDLDDQELVLVVTDEWVYFHHSAQKQFLSGFRVSIIICSLIVAAIFCIIACIYYRTSGRNKKTNQ